MKYPPVSNLAVLKEYWSVARKYWALIIVVTVGVIVATISGNVIVPFYYKKFFDGLTSISTSPTKDIMPLVPVIFSILILNMVEWIGWRSSWFTTSYITGYVMRDCLKKTSDYLIDHSHSFFINNFAGSLVQRVNRFSRQFDVIFEKVFYDLTTLVLKVVGAEIVLYFAAPQISFAMLVWIIIFLIVSYTFTRFKLKYDIKAASEYSRLTGVLSDSISNHSSIQLFSGKNEETRRIDGVNTPLMKLNIFRWNISSYMDASQALLMIGIEFFVFYYGIHYWKEGLLSLGTFVLVQSYIIIIGNSLWGFGRVIRSLYEAVADAKEMVEIMHLPHEIQDIAGAKDIEVPRGEIEFKNVNFAFDINKPILNNLNLKIKSGERVALIGHSGAGKSTLVKLLLRLHDITSGEILVDGQNIKNVTQKSLRNNISLVPQDPVLFHRTLIENIRYGKKDASDEDVIKASERAHCDVFIQHFPQKYETYVGERGVKLSGGERQRVAIARALLKNAPVLILDEATSSLDSHSESLIQDALDTLMKGKTTLVIAHRLSTIRKMDRIVVLGKEGIVEEGSHEELIKKGGGVYSHLWTLQAGGFADKSIEELLDS